MKTIKVTGKGHLKLRPDTTRLMLTLDGMEPEYDAALSRSAEETRALAAALTAEGFDRAELKTLSFNISAEYEGYDDAGVWKQRFAGYRFRHALRLDFPADNERLGCVLSALAACPANAEIQISYTVSDPEAAKNALLSSAVRDAGEKAAVLAEAAGVTLGAIQTVDYSWGETTFEVRTMDALARPMAAKARFDMDVEPEDIDVSDTVTVIWEIA